MWGFKFGRLDLLYHAFDIGITSLLFSMRHNFSVLW